MWDADEALHSLADETRILDGDDPTMSARRIFRENAAIAATTICHIAKYCPSDRTRFEAAKYVVERNLGRIGEETTVEDDPLQALMASVVKSEESAMARARTTLAHTSSDTDDEEED
jgi:hypothetical protein